MKTKNTTHYFSTQEEMEDPPPPNLSSKFSTLEDWLTAICEGEKPTKAIEIFNFGLFESESPTEYIISISGTNKYVKENQSIITKIDFKPKNEYYKISDNYFKNLNREEVIKKLTSQIRAFTNTNEFKKSFLAQSKSITTDFSGEIWSK